MGLWARLKGEEPGLLNQWLHCDDKGHFGEYLIEYALNSISGYSKKLCNVYLPYNGRTSEIDVIMLHETGIYVFESKNYSGWIFGDESSQYWMQCLNPKTKNRFYNPIMQNRTHIRALQDYLGLDNNLRIYSYIIFSERCELKQIKNSSENISVVRRPDMLKSLRRRMELLMPFYQQEQIDEMYEKLLPLTDVTEAEKAEHVKTVQGFKETAGSHRKRAEPEPEQKPEQEPEQELEQEPNPDPAPNPGSVCSDEKEPPVRICPRCGAPMVLRTASKGANKGKKFWGCSNFPKCRGIINL